MIITISGPSGSGKTSLIKQLIKKYPNEIIKAISTTTREPKNYEVNGQDYNFIKLNNFNKKDFIEFTKFDKNFYGIKQKDIDKNIIKDKNKVIVINTDIKGMKMLKKHFHNINSIYSVYLEINEKIAKRRLSRRSGWNSKKAVERIQIDKKSGLYNREGFDCVISGYMSTKDKIENFLNYLESRKWILKLTQ